MSVLLALTGCGAPGDARPTPSVEGGDYLQQFAADLARDLGISDPPDVPLVREIARSDWAEVHSQCLQEAGFAATLSGDGGVLYPQLESSVLRDGLARATFVCEMQYPVREADMAPLTDAQLRELYEYRVGPLIDCLTREGINVSDSPPSEQVFVESGGVWNPFSDTLGVPKDEYLWLYRACPQDPASFSPAKR